MIRHIVLLEFKSKNLDENSDYLKSLLIPLVNQLNGIINVNIGVNVSPEDLHKGLDNGFIIDFETDVDRDNYLVHPEHIKVGEDIISKLKNGLDSLFVFDIEI